MHTGVTAPISTIKQLHGSGKWKMEATDLREDTGCICAVFVCLYTGVAWGFLFFLIFFGNTQFNFCNMHIETERHQHVNGTTSTPSNGTIPTTAVTTLATADAKNSSLNPVSTPRSTKQITCGSIAKVNVCFCSQNPTPFSLFIIFFFLCQDAKLHQYLTSHECRALCFEAQQHGMLHV